MGKFYLTTPIYYVNDAPHIGHLYTTIAADVIARYRRKRGDDVFLLTGTDENSQKNAEAAEKKGYKDVRTYVDAMSAAWQETFKRLDISFDGFIRTTEERHKKGVEKFWRAVQSRGDIYPGEYEGLYCAGCEAFVTEADLAEGKCPLHKKTPERLKEKNYFFKLSAYRQKLLDHIDSHPEFIRPAVRRNEVRSYVASFMEDVSISREGFPAAEQRGAQASRPNPNSEGAGAGRDKPSKKWGIPVPDDPQQVIYVWFDALINYLTGIGYGTDEKNFAKYWPADLHLVGKDIIKFHCALWPAMLMSAGIELPKQVFAHGFFTVGGEKMSKSLGNVIDPVVMSEKYGNDALRFFLLREIPFGGDGDFSPERLAERYEGDLANEFGNLLHRVLSMTEKYFDGRVPPKAGGSAAAAWDAYELGMDSLNFSAALGAVWGILRESNKFIDSEQPWTLAKTDKNRLAEVIYILLENLRHSAHMLMPIMPAAAENTLMQLGVADTEKARYYEEIKIWGGMREGDRIVKGTPIFPKR